MNELGQWEEVETLYRSRGVAHYPHRDEVCLLTAAVTVRGLLRTTFKEIQEDSMIQRLARNVNDPVELIGRSPWQGVTGITRFNDTHSKEDNLAVIAQCRTECAAETLPEKVLT